MTQSVPVKIAAEIMGKSEMFVRMGLRLERLPFGTAVKNSTRWTYYISPARFSDYVGLPIKELKERCEKLP